MTPNRDTHLELAFAVPGNLANLTGGYKYDRRLIQGLRNAGWSVKQLRLGDSFPQPTSRDMQDAAHQLATVNKEHPLIIDGLALGAFDQVVMEAIQAPVVALIHHPLAKESGLSNSQRARFLNSERENLKQVSHILAPSPHTANVLVRDYDIDAAQITIARPGTDFQTKSQNKDKPPLILSVGIQVPRKGHDILLKALSRIDHLSWKAVIAGGAYDQDHASALERLVTDLGLSDRVTLAGQVSEERLSDLYARASIFALATRYEGYGIVFDEAMAYGLPIVSCTTGAVSETVAKGAGVLVQPEDPSSFADALAKTLCDEQYRTEMASASNRAGKSLPTWRVTTEEVDTLLKSIVAKQAVQS